MVLLLVAASLGPTPAGAAEAPATGVGALGRLQPRNGVIRVAGPSSMGSIVVARLLVETGQRVTTGQALAELDTLALSRAQAAELDATVKARQAAVDTAAADLSRIEAEHARQTRLHREGVVSDSEEQVWSARWTSARADLRRLELEKEVAELSRKRAELEIERAIVRASCDGQVLRVHAHDGEKIDGDRGLLEIGMVDHMYAVAEVYETDLARVKVGQRATVSSPALPGPLSGIVERIGLRVGVAKLTPSDPMARSDVRVVPVDVRLDDSAAAAGFTDLEVEVRIGP
ncbi:MAG: efflux RND transporter periplasmic adaptor subunit [Acidobacteriota bacterium]